MTTKLISSWLALFLLLSGCQTPVNENEIFDVRFTEVASGDQSQISFTKGFILRNQQQWADVWRSHLGDLRAQPPKVDFDTEMVIAVFLGTQPTGGHRIEVTRIQPLDRLLLIDVKITNPPPHAKTTMALTQPYTMIKLPRYDKPVRFNYR